MFEAILFDIQITMYLAVTAALAFFSWRLWRTKTKIDRRIRTVAPFVCAAALVTLGVLVWGSFIEPRLVAVKRVTIPLSHNPASPVTIALISDLHVGIYKKSAYVQKFVNKLLALRPDAVIIAGDVLYGQTLDNQLPYVTPLRALAAQIPTFFVLGNHEYGKGTPAWPSHPEIAEAVIAEMKRLGVIVLRDQAMTINTRKAAGRSEAAPLSAHGATVTLVGLDEIWEKLPDWSLVREEAAPNIVIAHSPDVVLLMPPEVRPDLILAGHTHGGQVRLPFLGAVGRIPTLLGDHFDKGLKFWKNIPVFVTSGIGESGPRARLFNPPEIALITIQ